LTNKAKTSKVKVLTNKAKPVVLSVLKARPSQGLTSLVRVCASVSTFHSTTDLPRREVLVQTPLQEWYLWAVQASRPLSTTFQQFFHPTERRVISDHKEQQHSSTVQCAKIYGYKF